MYELFNMISKTLATSTVVIRAKLEGEGIRSHMVQQNGG